MHDSHKKTALKTVTWRIIASLTTMILVYLFTGEVSLMLGVGVFDVLLKMFFYYLHERAWNKISL